MASLLIPPPEDPVRAAAQWLGEAEALGRRNANALALASVDAAGRPSARMVLLKELAPLGYIVFYTNYGSRKAEELLTTGRAAGVLYWHELGRQVRFEGPVVRSPDAESDAYFATRPLASQVNAWSSEQSRPLADSAALEERAAKIVVTKPEGRGLPRPDFWGGFRLWLDAVELWVEGRDRFHERVRYERRLEAQDPYLFKTGRWTWQRLQP
jgi:pyridoxamine 5'-phosphate oxidase